MAAAYEDASTAAGVAAAIIDAAMLPDRTAPNAKSRATGGDPGP